MERFNEFDLSVATDFCDTQAQSDALRRSGAADRRERTPAADMITTDEATEIAGTSRVTFNAWIKASRCSGVSHLRRGFKLLRGQFDPFVLSHLQPLSQALGSTKGRQAVVGLFRPLRSFCRRVLPLFGDRHVISG